MHRTTHCRPLVPTPPSRQTHQRADQSDLVGEPDTGGSQHEHSSRRPDNPGRALCLDPAPFQRGHRAHAARAVVGARRSLQRRIRALAAERLGAAHRQLRRRARGPAGRPLGSPRRQLQRRARATPRRPGDRAARRLAAEHWRRPDRGVAFGASQEPSDAAVATREPRWSARRRRRWWSFRCGLLTPSRAPHRIPPQASARMA